MFEPPTKLLTAIDVQDVDSRKPLVESRFPVLSLTLHAGSPDFRPDLKDDAGKIYQKISDNSLVSAFVEQALRVPDSTAIQTRSESWTYRQLLHAALQVCQALRASPDFSSGSRVALLLPNSFEYVAGFYGILLADGVVVPLAHNRECGELQQIIGCTEATVAIVSPQGKRRLSFLNDVPVASVSLAAPHTSASDALEASPNDPHKLAAIFFTAGSTGSPKGVMLSHRNLISNAQSIQKYLSICQSDRPLCVLPFHHAYGNSVLQSHMLAGAALVLDGKPMFPETLIESIQHHHATSLSVVPDLVRMLLEHTSLGRIDLPSLRYMTVAGGALCLKKSLNLAERIAPAKLFLMYGQTEATARLAFVPPDQLSQIEAGCIGRAIPDVELGVFDEQDRQVEPGEIGELRARGANIMLGYWRDAEATAGILRNGWLATGDLAVQDRDGWFYHKGRRNALVKIAGYRVHPGSLEEFAVRRLRADQAAAVPYESPQVGTRLALFVCPSAAAELTQAEMLGRCHEELPRHLVPGMIRVLDSFPLNSALKLDRIFLSRMAEQEACQSSCKSANQTE